MRVLLSPSRNQIVRLNCTSGDLPRWFAAPILSADPDLTISRSLSDCVKAGLCGKPFSLALIFHVGKLEAFLTVLPKQKMNVVSLHQWWPPELLSSAKRLIYQRILHDSRIILTYSYDDLLQLRERFPSSDVRWIGHYVDTSFFTPGTYEEKHGEFILCPGDHRRLENVVIAVAEALKIRVLRFTTDPNVLRYHREHNSEYVECLGNIPFSEVLNLYRSAKFVLNAVDDRYWPAGITTFCEALSVNQSILTSGGHSCSGYQLAGITPYHKIEDIADVSSWITGARNILEIGSHCRFGNQPRNLALNYCSIQKMTSTWRNIISDATPQI